MHRFVYFYVRSHGSDSALDALNNEALSPVVEVLQPRWESRLRFRSDTESLSKVSVQLVSVSSTSRGLAGARRVPSLKVVTLRQKITLVKVDMCMT